MVRFMFCCGLVLLGCLTVVGCGAKEGTTMIEQPPTPEAEAQAYEEQMNQPQDIQQ